ncbi:MAG TPA: YvcK family protein [Fimbriimonadaceae bacterium]|nr:YvcK family protein [Fimbriimonadaceae bacterium]
MTNRYRLRRLVAPTAGFRKAVLVTLGGLFVFLVGLALSFSLIILPTLEFLSRATKKVLGFLVPPENLDTATHFMGGACLLLGIYLLFIGIRSALRHLIETINPGFKASGMVDVYVRRQQLAQGPRIVALGGGTGLSTLLRGLKQHSSNITAIVTVTDDGGSSGRLIQDKGMIPPGDIRNCLVALADAEKSMTDLFQHRFKDSGSLSGHSMGNLLIAALVDLCKGDFEKAIAAASDVLLIRGRVVPSTLEHVRLRAILDNGMEICGETNIVQAGSRIRKILLDPASVEPYKAALEAIREADLICIGPGSVYTSVIPNLLVPGIAQAIRESGAAKAYICNVMTQPGESEGFTACEHVVALQTNIQVRVCDFVLVNTGVPSPALIEKYREVGQHLVEPDVDRIRAMGFRVITGDFMSESDFVRHDPMRIATRLLSLVGR